PKESGLFPATGDDGQPANARGEQNNFGQGGSQHIHHKTRPRAFHYPSRNKRDQRISPQITGGRPDHLGNASGASRGQYRQSHRAPRQVQAGGGKSPAASQCKTDQQNAEVGERQRNGSVGQGNHQS